MEDDHPLGVIELVDHACDWSEAQPGSGLNWWMHLKQGHKLPHHHLFW